MAFGIAPAIAAGLVAWRFAGLALDDIYITYRYAWNLAQGQGFVFNPGERVFGVTDPGVGLVLGLAHAETGVAIPALGSLLTALALWGIAACLGGAAVREARWPEGLAAGLLIASSPYLWTAQGSGPPVALALLLAASAVSRRWPLLSGALAGLAFWCRPDALLGVALLGLLLWVEDRRFPLRFAAASAAVALAGLVAAQAAFGTFVPATLGAKRQFAALNPEKLIGARVFWGRTLFHFGHLTGRFTVPIVLLGVAGQVPLWRSGGRVGRLLVLFGAAIALAYTLLRVPFFLWYTVPPVVAVLAGAAWGGGSLVRWALGLGGSPESTRSPRARGARLLAVLLIGLALAGLAGSALLPLGRWYAGQRDGDWRTVAYRAAGEWIRGHSAPDESVFAEEIGIMGFYSERRVEDPIGLVSPRSLPYAAVGDMIGAFLARPTDLVVFHTFTRRGGSRPVVGRPWFARAYREAAKIDLPRLGGTIFVYRRLPGSPLPPPRPPRARRPPAPAAPPATPASAVVL